MQFPAHLRASFVVAFREAHGVDLAPERADSIAMSLLDIVGCALTIRAQAIHRSKLLALDGSRDKRDAGDATHPAEV